MRSPSERGFFRYDATELREQAERFVADLARLRSGPPGPEIWTEVVLDWLAAAASDRARVDASTACPHLTAELYESVDWARPRSVIRSCPVAMIHSSHPTFSAGHPYGYAYWEEAFQRERLETLLAVACEWGGGGRPAARYGRVMLAAADVAGLDARAKAVLYASDTEEERRRIEDGLRRLRLASWDARPWLVVDVPWRSDWSEHGPDWTLLEG